MALLWLAFFCSGVAGLSYELTWVRYLAQLFGASTPAVSATLSIFFTGLALGAALGGRLFDRCKRPLLVYAGLELMIGLFAAMVPFFFHWAELVLAGRLVQAGAESPMLLLFVSAVILLIPTTLLGATFPAMAAVVRHLANPTYSTGFFYGFNTLGAVFGCLVVSFWLLPSLGQHTTTWVMALANGGIALLLWSLHRWSSVGTHGVGLAKGALPSVSLSYHLEEGMSHKAGGGLRVETSPKVVAVSAPFVLEDADRSISQPLPAVIVEGAVGLPQKLSRPMALTLAGVSGFLAIGIEVLWTRALALSFPSSSNVFALVLSAYLVGIGLGAVAMGVLYKDRQASPGTLLLLYLAIGAGSILTLLIFPQLTPWSMQLVKQGWLGSWSLYMGWIGASAVLAMLPATLAMGAALPLLIGLATQGSQDASRTAGRIYAVNTIGGVLGSFFVTFTLLPVFGLGQSLFVLALGYGVLAFLMSVGNRSLHVAMRWSVAAVLVVGGLTLTLGGYPEANPLRQRADRKLLSYHDAPSATLAVYQTKKKHHLLYINNQKGFRDTFPQTVAMQYRLGHLSALLHPKPRRLLLLGFGTGATLSALSSHGIPEIQCIEMFGGKLRSMAGRFARANLDRSWRRSRSKVSIRTDDGRRALLRPGPRFDVIVSDVFHPRHPSVGALYSIEHFRAARKRLTDRGIFAIWFPLHQVSPRTLAAITQTFLAVYPKAEAWVASWSRQQPVLGLVGYRGEVLAKASRQLERRFFGALSRSFGAYNRRTPSKIRQRHRHFGRKLLGARQLALLAKGAPINRLERPVIEFLAPRALMHAQLKGASLATQNIRSFSQLRSLKATPWASFHSPRPPSR